jgi:hypothetical protein
MKFVAFSRGFLPQFPHFRFRFRPAAVAGKNAFSSEKKRDRLTLDDGGSFKSKNGYR